MNVSTALGRLRLIGFLEGISFLVLLGVAMPLKYLAGLPEAVRIVGLAHGVLFIAYLAAIIHAQLEYKDWPLRRSGLVLLASFLPFGPFVVDRKVLEGLPE
jgi:integral membrane protein